MNTIEQALLAYYNYCNTIRAKYKKDFFTINTVLGITLICKN
jgi:hypothetical protein